jgi:prepilin-type N-terminal cleavage/methylation domain-containing protein
MTSIIPSTSPSPHQSLGRRGSLWGVTLIELMLVMALVGILGVIGFSTFAQQAQLATVKQIAAQLQGDLENLRSRAIRFNNDATFSLDAGNQKYTLTVPNGATNDSITREIPAGITVSPDGSSIRTVTYSAPLSQISAIPRVYKIALGKFSVFVKIIGVTGRAVQSATN